MNTIRISRNDILPLVYFIVSMFQQESTHRQGTSSKSDYLGGFIDRWINKIPENLLFNNLLLKNKEFEVITDFFIYGAQADKNAPDILGLRAKNNILKFAEFIDNTWKPIPGMPFIEVKTFKKSQHLVSVRETQLNHDSYYVLVESDLRPDYLITMFDNDFVDDELVKRITMDECFIKSNNNKVLIQPQPVHTIDSSAIGTIKLITIIKGQDFRERTVKCAPKENIFYVKKIEQKKRVTSPNINDSFQDVFEACREINTYGRLWQGKKMIPLTCSNPNNILVVKKNKKSAYIKTTGPSSIYNEELEANKIYCITLEEFDRSSDWTEYVGLKNQYAGVLDRTNELTRLLVELYDQHL